MITIIADNKEVKVDWIEFSDGALTCKVDSSLKEAKSYASLSVCPTTPVKQVLEEIELVLDSIFYLLKDSLINIKLYLNLPYLPYGRGDRVFEEGNPKPLDTFLLRLSEYNKVFDEINICDIHNSKAIGPFYNLNIKEKSQLQCFKQVMIKSHKKYSHIIAPDKGAKDKSSEIANYFGYELVLADKKRDISTGRIIETKLTTKLPSGSSVIIVDDILDGGYTFIPLAEELRSQDCTVDLYVTHLIAAKGLGLFKGLIDNIYCHHIVGNYINMNTVLDYNLGK